MKTNHPRSGSRPAICEPAAGEPTAAASGVKLPNAIGKERLEALRCELDENNNRWPVHIAATINEDYRQLMKDFGLC